jgi:hypothetical protein
VGVQDVRAPVADDELGHFLRVSAVDHHVLDELHQSVGRFERGKVFQLDVCEELPDQHWPPNLVEDAVEHQE